MNILAWTGYWVGFGIELFVIVIAATILVLLLTGVFFVWLENIREWIDNEVTLCKEWYAVTKEEREQEKAEKRARAEAAATARAEADEKAAEADAEAALAEDGSEEDKGSKKKKKKSKKGKDEESEADENSEKAEGETAEGDKEEEKPAEEEDKSSKKKKKVTKTETVVSEEGTESNNGETIIIHEKETVVVQEGVVFNESKTITELYEELSAEQKGYFDELREAALAKPDAELAMSRNFVAVKIGKRNLIKLLIKRGITVAEFLIENEALKALRLSNTNKRGKSSIKVKPTNVNVMDIGSLQVAIDMISLAYDELINSD